MIQKYLARWRSKYFEKCTEFNISEAKLDIAVEALEMVADHNERNCGPMRIKATEALNKIKELK